MSLSTTHLAPISLDELNATASLLTRVDRKYVLPGEVAQELLDSLTGRAQVLTISDAQAFTYASTYFDTPELDSYLLAAHKRRRRWKVRSRSYVATPLSFLEVKTRGARGATVKKRIRQDPLEASDLTAAGRRFVTEQLAAVSAEPGALASSLQPVMRNSYRRTTLLLPDDDARLTMDTELQWSGSGLFEGKRGALKDAVIVETKNPTTPSPADRWLWRAGYRPTVISKYCTGLAAQDASLPANKWHRIMGQYELRA